MHEFVTKQDEDLLEIAWPPTIKTRDPFLRRKKMGALDELRGLDTNFCPREE